MKAAFEPYYFVQVVDRETEEVAELDGPWPAEKARRKLLEMSCQIDHQYYAVRLLEG